ncbi:MAG: sulfotransferase [Burkholderiales bacterium]|nr:sulfotransferase [Burkholderiales bacterium]
MAISLPDKPIFIVGQERSGTTLLMAMLGCHPRVAVPEVAWWYPRFRGYLHTYGDLDSGENLRTLANEMIFGLMVPFWGMPANPRTIADEVISNLRERSFAGIYCSMLERYARWVGKPRWGEKTPNNVFYVREILEDFPGAQFLCLTRDARDVAADAIRSSFGPTNAYAAAKEWKFGQQTIQRLRANLPSAAWLDIHYERLVNEPEDTLRLACGFLGEEYSNGMLDFHRASIARNRARIRDHSALGGPVTTRYVGIYKEQLSIRDQRIVLGVAGPEMKTEGYTSDLEPLVLEAEEAAYQDELDGRYRAAMLDGPGGRQHVWESYNDWLADQREARRKRGVWRESDIPRDGIVGHEHEDLMTGVRAPARWKRRFSFKPRFA